MILKYLGKGEKKLTKKITPQERYVKKNIQQIMVKINRKTEPDILERINAVNNKNGYIKTLIKNDDIVYKDFLKKRDEMKKQWREFLGNNPLIWSYNFVPNLVEALDKAFKNNDQEKIAEILDSLGTQGIILDNDNNLKFWNDFKAKDLLK